MNIARRYLFSRKISLVNVISFIAIFGVAGMTAALIVILSVFNGFDSIIRTMMNKFDPDIKVSPAQGKTFLLDPAVYQQLSSIEGVRAISVNVEETSLFEYDGRQYIATMKGVDSSYARVSQIPECVYQGSYILRDSMRTPYAIVGSGVASNLWIQQNGMRTIQVYAPLRHEKITMNPDDAFHRALIMPGGVFHIHQDYDDKYVVVPLDFAQRCLNYAENEISFIEIACLSNDCVDDVADKIRSVMGGAFLVKNRYQQQDILFKIMRSEKLSIFVMLSFIIVIASFNIIGALSMLIIDKKNDIQTLSHLGASSAFVKAIFRYTGQLITLLGVVLGMVLGLLVCWLQIEFQFLKFPDGSFIMDYYPVDVRFMDVLATFAVVVIIGFVASSIPSRKISEQ